MSDTRSNQPILQIRHLDLSFGGSQVLHDVSLSVHDGEVLALIGPNGAGKSALLNCICGIYRPSGKASIALDGKSIARLPPHRIARMGISRTFQGLNLIPERPVLDNVLLGWSSRYQLNLFGVLARPLSSRREERLANQKAEALIERCGLSPYRMTRCADLPLGILRRVDLARALLSEPRLLLLDEPASGLSHDERPLIGEMVQLARQQEGRAVLWIEHDLDLVLTQAERAIVLHHGEVIDTGQPQQPDVRQRLILAYKQGKRTDTAADTASALTPSSLIV